MSFQAMTWATAQKVPALQKLVLLMLANRLNHDTGKCIPKIKTLADECGMSETAVKTAIKGLSDAGLVTVVPRFQESVQLPNSYVLNIDQGLVRVATGWDAERPRVGRQTPDGGSPDAPGVGRQTPTEPGSFNQEENREEKHTPQPPKGEARKRADDLKPEDVAEQVWSDWCVLRKSKRAAVTATAIEGIRREAKRAGLTMQQALEACCAHGWQGLKAEWMTGKNGRPMNEAQRIAQRDEKIARLKERLSDIEE